MPTTATKRVVSNPSWGNWRLYIGREPSGFDNEPLLVHTPTDYRYSAEDVGDFINALDELLVPQINLGLGSDGSFNARAYV
jgi:hypothetical protein